MALVLTCTESGYDASTGACSAEVWVPQPTLLPPLSAEEGSLVATAMITVCATAWGFKALRRYVWPKA